MRQMKMTLFFLTSGGHLSNSLCMKEKLTELSKTLMALHKSLLHFEAHLQEVKQERKFTPHEMLHLSLNDPSFSWLKKISDLIVQIDENVDDKEVIITEKDFLNFAQEANDVFFPKGPASHEFHGKIMQAVTAHSEIMLQLSMLRNFFKTHKIG